MSSYIFITASAFVYLTACLRQIGENISGDKTGLTVLGCDVASKSVQIHTDWGCHIAGKLFSGKTGNRSGKNIAAAGSCHSGIACGRYEDVSVRIGDKCFFTFKYEYSVEILRCLAGDSYGKIVEAPLA